MPVKYDVAKQQVVDINNYAMHAGDWLEVTEDTSTVLDRMLESATQPLRPHDARPRGTERRRVDSIGNAPPRVEQPDHQDQQQRVQQRR